MNIAGAIVVGSAIIAASIYMQPVPGRFSYKLTPTELRRFDSATGEVRVCLKNRDCFTVDWQ